MSRLHAALVAVLVAPVLGACTADSTADPPQSAAATGSASDTSEAPSPEPSTEPPVTPTRSPPSDPPLSEPPPEPVRFDGARAMASVRHLALEIGPREATSRAFARSADWVQAEFTDLGYDVLRQRVRVPAGVSWQGADVPAGTSVNVVADPAGFDPRRPHIVVGAHLDTVHFTPGAEDNASGVGTMLELARLASLDEPAVPVRFVAFGAEEPRGTSDDLHHFGSTRYVELMGRAERRALVAMVSLDRVGVRGPYVPACSGPGGATGVRNQLARSARALGIGVQLCDDNASSDHWSFTKAGLPSARLGSISYVGYHNAGDLPSMVDPTQLHRVGRTMWHWLRSTPQD